MNTTNPLIAAAYRNFGRLPESVRHAIVGWTSPIHRVGTTAIVQHDGRLLLCRHSYREGWSLPGGMIGREESPWEGVRREVREELGIDVHTVGEPYVYVIRRPRRIEFVFDAELDAVVDPEGIRPGSPEIVEASWFDPDDLPDMHHITAEKLAWVAGVRAERQASASPIA